MKYFVDDLLLLFDHGVIVRTRSCPEGTLNNFVCMYDRSHGTGRRVRLILIAVCCDHPALCRMCGFGDHMTKTYFCTRCKIQHASLATEEGLSFDGTSLYSLFDLRVQAVKRQGRFLSLHLSFLCFGFYSDFFLEFYCMPTERLSIFIHKTLPGHSQETLKKPLKNTEYTFSTLPIHFQCTSNTLSPKLQGLCNILNILSKSLAIHSQHTLNTLNTPPVSPRNP